MQTDPRKIKEYLTAADCEVRIATVRQLAQLPEFSLELFSVCLGDTDWRVRKAAIETFFKLSHPENLVAEVMELLHQQENTGLRNAAIEILIELGPLAVNELQREICCPDVGVRKFVIDILGEIGDQRCSDQLIAALGDPDINVRYAAAETLGKLKSHAAVPALLESMNDPDPGLKFIILQALATIGGPIPTAQLLPFLGDRLLRKALFDCFGKIGGSEVIPHLVDGLGDPMKNVREAALRSISERQTSEPEAVRRALTSAATEQVCSSLDTYLAGENFQLKEAALAIYGLIAKGRDLTPLLHCVAEERCRTLALKAFSDLGVEAYTELLNRLRAPDSLQRLYLLFVGSELKYRAALPLAIDAAHSSDQQLRYASARALGELDDPTHLELLLQLLEDEVPEIQDAATSAIATLGQRHLEIVIERTRHLFVDKNAEKRMRFVRILGRIKGHEIEALLLKAFKDSSSRVRGEAIRALKGHVSAGALAGLTFALTDESPEVRRLAVSALGHYPQQEALRSLTLAAADPDLWVRSAVMRALGTFSGDEVRDLLLRGAADTVGLVAISALESSAVVLPGDSRSLLEHALTHPDEEVVKSAMTLLGRIDGKDWIGVFASSLLNHPHWDVRVQAAKALGQCSLISAVRLLEERLIVEGEDLVRQALESAITCRLRAANMSH